MKFLIDLKPRGLRMCVGFDELMRTLDLDLQDMTDISAFHWWRSQAISGAGVPDNLVPAGWPMARFSLTGRLVLPEKSVDVGPVYLSGDCKQTGQSLAPPWLLLIALVAVGINIWDMSVHTFVAENAHWQISEPMQSVVVVLIYCGLLKFVGVSASFLCFLIPGTTSTCTIIFCTATSTTSFWV